MDEVISVEQRVVNADSLQLARFLLKRGEQGIEHRDNCPNYRYAQRLQDGREVKIYLSDRDKTGDANNMSHSELRIYLEAVMPSQFGFESGEWGLSGKWYEYVLRLGTPTGDGFTAPKWSTEQFIPLGSNVSGLVNNHFQARYDSDKKMILRELQSRS